VTTINVKILTTSEMLSLTTIFQRSDSITPNILNCKTPECPSMRPNLQYILDILIRNILNNLTNHNKLNRLLRSPFKTFLVRLWTSFFLPKPTQTLPSQSLKSRQIPKETLSYTPSPSASAASSRQQ